MHAAHLQTQRLRHLGVHDAVAACRHRTRGGARRCSTHHLSPPPPLPPTRTRPAPTHHVSPMLTCSSLALLSRLPCAAILRGRRRDRRPARARAQAAVAVAVRAPPRRPAARFLRPPPPPRRAPHGTQCAFTAQQVVAEEHGGSAARDGGARASLPAAACVREGRSMWGRERARGGRGGLALPRSPVPLTRSRASRLAPT